MNRYRSATLALAAGAATLAVAACSSGTPSASSASSSSTPSSSSTRTVVPITSEPAPTGGAPIPGRTLQVKGQVGSFPIPATAKIGENISGGSSLIVVFGLVDPSDVSRFYATALPQAGYTVTSNSLVSQGGQHGALIAFSGHGYKGNIEAVAQFPGASLAGIGDQNVTTIIMSPQK